MAIYLRGDRRRPFLYLFLSGLFLGGTVNFHTGYTFGLLATVLVFIAGAILQLLQEGQDLGGRAGGSAADSAAGQFQRTCGAGLRHPDCVASADIPEYRTPEKHIVRQAYSISLRLPRRMGGVERSDSVRIRCLLVLQYATQGHPYGLSDRPGENILASTYPSVDGFKAGFTDFANIVAARPWDYLSIMANKLFLMLDTKLSEEYPTDRELGPFEWLMFNSISGTNLFSLLNYCVIAMALSFLCTKRLRATLTRAEIATFLGVFVLIGLPRLVAHVEWRYFMAIYASLYYVVAYSVAGNLEAFRELPSAWSPNTCSLHSE